MSTKFVQYKPADAYRMDWLDKDEFSGCLKRSPQFFYILESEAPLTVVKDGEIAGIITTREFNKYHVYVNMFMAQGYKDGFDKELYQVTKDYVKHLCDDYPRVSAEAKASNAKLIKWMEALGFKKEALMRKFGDFGEDYILYAIVRED